MQKILHDKKISRYQYNSFVLLIAEAMIQLSQYHDALAIYDSVSLDNEDIYNKALATLKRINYLYGSNIVEIQPSIDELEKLKVLVRSEGIEANVLDILGKLYIQNKQYYKGLSLFKEIHVNFSYYQAY